MPYQKKTASTAVRIFTAIALSALLFQCSEEQIIAPQVEEDVTLIKPDTIESHVATSTVLDCIECTYVVPANTTTIDGEKLNLKPGSVIGLNAATPYKNLQFKNIVGTAENPIIIRNCNGTAVLTATGRPYGWKFWKSKHIKISGGSTNNTYGIKITGGHISMTMDYLTTDFEIDHVEITNSGFAGIMAKTDPSCDPLTSRDSFTMRNVSIHHNNIHDIGGEGIYVGNSKYVEGHPTPCGIRYPHNIENVKIYKNKIKNSGWDGIQLGCGKSDAEVNHNKIENFGLVAKFGQANGIQIGAGTGGSCYGNFILNGKGNGIVVFGLGDNVIHNNIIVGAGENGIFCDERGSTGRGFQFINNTIINPAVDGIRIYSEKLPDNAVINNIIVNPGSLSKYTGVYIVNAYVQKLSREMNVRSSNNIFTDNINNVKFIDAGAHNYRIQSNSPAVDKGTEVSAYQMAKDFYLQPRFRGHAFDIGASEF